MANISERGPRREPVEWLPDRLSPADRRARMLEQAQVLGCVAPVEASLALVRGIEGFTRPGNLYIGPSEVDIEAQLKIPGIVNAEGARVAAWNDVRKQYGQFDLLGASGPSDWLRLVGVWRAAIQPGDGVPGIFELRPNQFRDSDPAGRKFADWAQAHHLSPRMLSQACEQLAQNQLLHTDRDRAKFAADVKAADVKALEKAILAGFDLEDIYLQNNTDQHYLPWQQALLSADPAERNRLHEQVKTVVRELLTTGQFAEAARALGATERRMGWMASRSRDQDVLEDLVRKAEQVAEQHVYAHEQGLEISNQSSGYQRRFPAAVVTAQSRVGDRVYGHGIHAVSAGLIRMLAPDQVVRFPLDVQFDRNEGRMVTPMTVHLVSRQGPALGMENEPVTTVEAVARFAHLLTTGYDLVPQFGGGRSAEVHQFSLQEYPWLAANRELVDSQLEQNWARSKGRLPRQFDLAAWYQERLMKLGHITSLEVATHHSAELQLHVADIYSEPDQQTVLAELEQHYPRAIRLGHIDYSIDYEYTDTGVENLTATIYVPTGNPTTVADFLQLQPSDIPTVGTTTEPVAIRFAYRNSRYMEPTTDLVEAQDTLDPQFLERQWNVYPERDYQQALVITPADAFPRVEEVLTLRLAPYGRDRRGQEHYPVPVITHVAGDQYVIVLRRTADEATRQSTVAERFHANARRALEVAGLSPDLRTQAETTWESLQAAEKAVETDRYQRAVAQYASFRLTFEQHQFDDWITKGEFDRALQLAERLRQEFQDRIVRPAEYLRQSEQLVEQLSQHYIRVETIPADVLAGVHYRYLTPAGYGHGILYTGESSERPSRPPMLNAWPPLIERLTAYLQTVIAERAVQRQEQERIAAEERRLQTEFEQLPAALRLERIREALAPAHQLVVRIARNLNRQPRRGPNYHFASNELNKLRRDNRWTRYRDQVETIGNILQQSLPPEELLTRLQPHLTHFGTAGDYGMLLASAELVEAIESFRNSARVDYERIEGYLL